MLLKNVIITVRWLLPCAAAPLRGVLQSVGRHPGIHKVPSSGLSISGIGNNLS